MPAQVGQSIAPFLLQTLQEAMRALTFLGSSLLPPLALGCFLLPPKSPQKTFNLSLRARAVEVGKEGTGVTRKEDGAVAPRAAAAFGKENGRQMQMNTSMRARSFFEKPYIFLYIEGVFGA